MGIEFKWQESWTKGEAGPEGENTPRRWWPPPMGVYVALGVLVLISLGAGAWWVVQANSTLGRARSEIQAAIQAEDRAIAANNLDAYLALQDPEDRSWQAYQRLRFSQLVQAAAGQVETPRILEVGQVASRRWAELELNRNGVPYRWAQFYRQRPAGWFRASYVADYWGRDLSQQIGSVQVNYSQREQPWVEPVITALGEVDDQMVGTLSLTGTQLSKIVFQFARNQAAPAAPGANLRFVLPSPLLDGVRADGQPDPALLDAMADDVAAVWVAQRANAPFSATRKGSNWPVYNAAAAWLVDQALPQGVGATQRKLALSQAIQHQVEFSLPNLMATFQPGAANEASSDPATIQVQSLALVQFVGEKYGSNGLSRLLAALPPDASLPQALGQALGIGPQAFDVTWRTWLKSR